jgi:hypothetical protein
MTGLYILWILLKSPVHLLTTDWGIRSFFLLTTATALLIMRLGHFFLIRRTMHRVQGRTISDDEARSTLVSSLSWETGIGVLLVLSVGILIATATPPGHAGDGGLFFTMGLVAMIFPILLIGSLLFFLSRKIETFIPRSP